MSAMPNDADHVIITYATASGALREYDFMIDDYAKRDADGNLDRYLTERVVPKLKREWHPIFTEVGRWYQHQVLRDGEYVAAETGG